jgi:hypothetical protein
MERGMRYEILLKSGVRDVMLVHDAPRVRLESNPYRDYYFQYMGLYDTKNSSMWDNHLAIVEIKSLDKEFRCFVDVL